MNSSVGSLKSVFPTWWRIWATRYSDRRVADLPIRVYRGLMKLRTHFPSSHSLTAPVHPPERVTASPQLLHPKERYPAMELQHQKKMIIVQYFESSQMRELGQDCYRLSPNKSLLSGGIQVKMTALSQPVSTFQEILSLLFWRISFIPWRFNGLLHRAQIWVHHENWTSPSLSN